MSGRQDKRGTQDFRSFRALGTSLPATKIGVVVALFPEIQGLQHQGHKTRAIWESLHEDGLGISYELFRVYLGRARRKLNASGGRVNARVDETIGGEIPAAVASHEAHSARQSGAARIDPFAGIRRSLRQKAKERFEYDPLAPLKEDLLR